MTKKLVLLHGFTQRGHLWNPIIRALSDDLGNCDIHTLDLPGHGDAPIDGDLWRSAQGLTDEVGPAHWVGYSLGARTLLHIAIAHPEVVQSMILVGASAGFASPDEARTRRAHDENLASRLEQMSRDEFIAWLNDEWLTQPLFSKLPIEARGVDIRATNDPANLAKSLRLHGVGSQDYLLPRLSDISVPATVIRGEYDNARVAHDCELIARTLPNADLITVDGVGHSVPWEATKKFAAVVARKITDGL